MAYTTAHLEEFRGHRQTNDLIISPILTAAVGQIYDWKNWLYLNIYDRKKNCDLTHS